MAGREIITVFGVSGATSERLKARNLKVEPMKENVRLRL